MQWWHLVVVLVLLALFVGALVSIARSPRLSPTAKFVRILVCLVLQFFGPLVWFVGGRHTRPRPHPLY